MRLVIVQNNPLLGHVTDNLAAVRAALGETHFDLLVLPELFATGYYFNNRDQVEGLSEEIPDGPTIDFLQELAAGRGGFVCGGLVERSGGRLYNSAVLVGPEGIVTTYRKMHLFFEENLWFAPGDRPPAVHDLGFARVGLMICYDWRFPEVARSLALLGAQIMLHPVNLVQPYCQEAMITRCVENGVFAATANRVGIDTKLDGEQLQFTGRSQVIAPDGQRLCSAETDTPQVLSIDIDPAKADDKQITPHNHLLADRRPECYQTLVDGN